MSRTTNSKRGAATARAVAAAPRAAGVGTPEPLPITFSAGAHGVGAEWLLTDGRGGFAMGTGAGAPTRRYHALLIAATKPPVGRTALLNATVDRLEIMPGTPQALVIELSSFRFAGLGDRLHPDGASRLVSVQRMSGDGGPAIEWTFRAAGYEVVRRLELLDERGEGGARLAYRVTPESGGTRGRGEAPARLVVRPLVSMRDMHALVRRDWAGEFGVRVDEGGSGCEVRREGPGAASGLALRLESRGGRFHAAAQWWNEFLYAEDAARGQDCVEDLYSPGEFAVEIGAGGAEMAITAGASHADPATGLEAQGRAARVSAMRSAALERVEGAAAELSRAICGLIDAADAFVVGRGNSTSAGERAVSVIAGYPWFSDWGRDTFISLPGLMLATGRHAEALATLRAFAAHRKHGLIPNVFDERTGEAEYNTVDGSLWFVQAACAYAETTGDSAAWREHLAPACLDVIGHYRRGTEFNIAMDPFDRLITAGTSATQLTWMDARRDGVVFTPRHGKAVEINALWISGLRRVARLQAPQDASSAANLNDLADAAARSFARLFWNDRDGCLFDVLTPSDSERGEVSWTPDRSIRPNQILAVSLPHSPLNAGQQRAVIACVRSRLWTPMGVRTLDPADARYRGRYEGRLFDRDAAYHQGTAWPWLLGPLAEAVMRSDGFSEESRREAMAIISPILGTLTAGDGRGGAAGQIAEIFDGDAPQRVQGCPAQAWSVAELLRAAILIGSRHQER